ncbi:cytochrome c-type biogenesis protein CcmH [Bryobacter aggregatus]|uniref:cytochrome c-type biogenesis protein CcmH n=1 Tax=Bryobacter aggregatus TaxID=360054 RepID=UPI0004E14DBD|nr:cytochrome c-type biogenesis protein CcmH [Bryobacter aggregatus]
MRKLKSLGLLAFLAAISIAQNPMDFVSPEIKRVGMKLSCLCGGCRNAVGDCSMIACGYSLPARQKIKQLQTMGASDSSIVGRFVKEQGVKALVEPEVTGFGLLGWLMPGFALALGFIAILVYVKRFRSPSVKVESTVKPEVIAGYEATAAREFDRMEP